MKYKKDLDFAIAVAKDAGQHAMKYFGKFEAVGVHKDGWSATSTISDVKSDTYIVGKIQEKYPNDGIYTEERTIDGKTGRKWRVDSIDGTNNFKRGNPEFAVLISLEQDKNMLAAVAYKPFYGETYFAQKDGGAWTNRNHSGKKFRRMKVSGERDLDEAVVSISSESLMPGNRDHSLKLISKLEELHPKLRFRIRESTGIDLVEVAAGCSTIHIGYSQQPWDYAAGSLLVKEAGGRFTHMNGKDTGPWAGRINIVASNGYMHDDILHIIHSV